MVKRIILVIIVIVIIVLVWYYFIKPKTSNVINKNRVTFGTPPPPNTVLTPG